MAKHPCHKEHIVKINRIIGQIDAIKKMIEENRYCVDILMQLKAARGAITRVQKDVLQTHMKHCVTDAITSQNREHTDTKIKEILRLMEDC